MSSVFILKSRKKNPPTMPPMKKLIIILSRKLIERVRMALCSLSLKKNSWDNSIPKSVNNPVK